MKWNRRYTNSLLLLLLLLLLLVVVVVDLVDSIKDSSI